MSIAWSTLLTEEKINTSISYHSKRCRQRIAQMCTHWFADHLQQTMTSRARRTNMLAQRASIGRSPPKKKQEARSFVDTMAPGRELLAPSRAQGLHSHRVKQRSRPACYEHFDEQLAARKMNTHVTCCDHGHFSLLSRTERTLCTCSSVCHLLHNDAMCKECKC